VTNTGWWWRGPERVALHMRRGCEAIGRFPTDDTIRNLFKRFRHKLV